MRFLLYGSPIQEWKGWLTHRHWRFRGVHCRSYDSRQIEVRDNSSSPRSFIISHPLRPYPTSPEKTRWLYYPDSPQHLRDFAQTIYCTEEFHNEWENRRNYTLVSFSQSANV